MSEVDRLESQIQVLEKEVTRISTDIDMKQKQAADSISRAEMNMNQAKKFDDDVKVSSFEQEMTHIRSTSESETNSMQRQLEGKKSELQQCKQKLQSEIQNQRTLKKRHAIAAAQLLTDPSLDK